MPLYLTSTSSASRIRFIGNRLGSLGNNTDSAGVNTTSRQRTGHRNLGTDIASVRVAFPNWKLNSGAVEAAGANDISVTAAIEYPSGTYHRLFFGGKITAAISPGATIWSDDLPIYIPSNSLFYVRSFVSVASAPLTWPRGHQVVVSGLGEASEEGVGLSDNTTSATAYGGFNGACYSPIAIAGIPATPSAKSVLLLGDSITWGQGDDATGVAAVPIGDGTPGNFGWASRACYTAGVGHSRMTRAGVYARDLVGASYRTRVLAQYASTAVILLGTNDLINGRTLAQLKSNYTEICNDLSAQGCRILGVTIPPRTSSTDGWATAVNQTANGSAYTGGASSVRSQFNSWLRGGTSPIYGVVELADSLETSRDSGIWVANYTSDGTHPNQSGHIAGATAMASAITSGMVM